MSSRRCHTQPEPAPRRPERERSGPQLSNDRNPSVVILVVKLRHSMNRRFLRASLLLGVALTLSACSATGSSSVAARTPSPVAGALVDGLIAYSTSSGIGVIDPATGKNVPITAFPPGAFRVAGPVWGPA